MDHYERQKIQDEHERLAGPPPERRSFIRSLLLWLPLLACAACLLGYYMLMTPLNGDAIPVTGRDPLIPPTITPAPDASAAPGTPEAPRDLPPAMPVPPGFSYRDEAMLRLESCNDAFHAFFLAEQVAVHQPEVAAQSQWKDEATQAMEAFRANCEPLGSMPAAPSAYSEVDTWLKMAAGEVAPAADGFHTLLESDNRDGAVHVIDHLLKFIEYTNKAEKLMKRLQERKQI